MSEDGLGAGRRTRLRGAKVQLPDCSAPLTLKALDSRDGISKVVPVSQAGQYELTARILEAGAGDADALLVCSVSVTRDFEPAPGDPSVTIRIARARESARLAFGKTHRIVLSPTFGRGDSALVLDVIVERAPARR